jgi:hypothetical protein
MKEPVINLILSPFIKKVQAKEAKRREVSGQMLKSNLRVIREKWLVIIGSELNRKCSMKLVDWEMCSLHRSVMIDFPAEIINHHPFKVKPGEITEQAAQNEGP